MKKILYLVIIIMACSYAIGQTNIIYLRYNEPTNNTSVIADSINAIYNRSDSCILVYCDNIYFGNEINALTKSNTFLLDPDSRYVSVDSLSKMFTDIFNDKVYKMQDSSRFQIKGSYDGQIVLTFVMCEDDAFVGKDVYKLIDINGLIRRSVILSFLIYTTKETKFSQYEYTEMRKQYSDTDMFYLNF